MSPYNMIKSSEFNTSKLILDSNLLKSYDFNKLLSNISFDVLNSLDFIILYGDIVMPASQNGEEMKWNTLA